MLRDDEVEIALISRPRELPLALRTIDPGWLLGIQPSPDLECPYDDLQRVRLKLLPSDTPAEVLGRAVAEFVDKPRGARRPPWIGFRLYEPMLADGFPPEETDSLWKRVPFVDDAGQLWWRDYSTLDLPYSWLFNASAVEVLRGDPRQPYLLLAGRGGIRAGLSPLSWSELAEIWQALKPWVEGVAAVSGSATTVAWLLRATRRLAASLHVAVKHSETWGSQGLLPDDIFRLLADLDTVDTPTRLTRLATLLDCSEEEAGLIVRLTLSIDKQRLDEQDEETTTNTLAAYLRMLLWERRNQDVECGVSSALVDAIEELDRLIPSQPPPPDPFEWDWPDRL